MFSIIAAIGKNRELGRDNQLIFRIKDDMRFFRETTSGHLVVMGRNTWESLPGKLPGRKNIVVSRGSVDGADEVVNDLDEFVKAGLASDEEIFVIGGGAIYREFLPFAKNLYLTEVDAECETADTFFPEFDADLYERKVLKEGAEGDLKFKIIKYTKKEA